MGANFFLISFVFLIFVKNSQQYEVVPSVSDPKYNIKDKDYGKGSLVFVFDTTGSMFNDLRQLREGAEMILKTALEDSNVIADFVFVPFHDPAVGPPTVTRNKDVFKSALNIVRVYGGGDCPEKSLTGIQMALKVSRPRSFVYVFTDATASDHRKVGSVLDSIQRKQSQVVFVLTGHCNDVNRPSYKVYQQIAAASSGQVFNLNKTSVHKVLDFVRTSIKGRTVNLGSAVHPAGYNYTQKVPVDKSVGEVTVSVSGAKPQIRVINPSGEEITGPPQLVTTLDLSEIMIVKVLEPEPGNWSITVGSEEEHSVKVVGLSNLTFQHGFSVKPTRFLEDTDYRPLQDAYNHMIISLSESNANASLHLENVQLLGLDGKAIFEVPLKSLDKSDGRTYIADAFVPPNDFFNIAIIGHDEFGQEVRRVGPTAVQVKPPEVPELTVPKRIRARTHERVRLSCRSHSAVPQTVAWSRAAPVTAAQSVTAEYVIKDMSEGDVGVYYCVARNVAGRSRASTIVDLIVDPPRVNISSLNILSLPEHGDLTIACDVFSEALLQRTQIVFNGTLQNYVIDFNLVPTMDGYYTFNKTIRNVSGKDSGVYTCVAVNRAGYTNDSTNIIIQVEPIVQILGPHTITKSAHSDVQLVCHVENALQVQWSHNDNIVKKYDVDGSYNAVLDIKNVTDDGVWTCVALRNSYKRSDSITLTVLIKPEVTIEGSKNITVLNGTTFQLTCIVVAKPAPRIVWHMETERFLPNGITNPEPKIYKSILTLDSQKESVNGTYFCYGENSEGIHQDSVTINVRRQMTVIKGFTDTSVELYSYVNLTCDIDAYPPPHITWYHNNTRIDTNDRISISDSNTVVNIHKVDFDDLGRYVCEAENGFENTSVIGTLGVHGLAKPLVWKEATKIVTQKGKLATITCRVTKGNPEPLIIWQYKHNDSDFTSLPDGVTINDYKHLVIAEVKKYHAGNYRCIAENVLGSDLYDVELTVQYPPEFNVSQENHLVAPVEVKSGVAIQLSCNVSGVPAPIVTWTKDQLPVTYSNRVYLNNDSVLVIANATTYDSGVFRCNASSALGFVTKDFNITVYTKPLISKEPTKIVTQQSKMATLACRVTKGNPEPLIIWQYIHNDSDFTSLPDGVTINDYKHLVIAEVKKYHAGNYRCIAENVLGSDLYDVELTVQYPPEFNVSRENHLVAPVEVKSGVAIQLSCNVSGVPAPIVTWTKDELPVTYSNRVHLNDDSVLVIANATTYDSGVFRCNASSALGFVTKDFNITVYMPPEISVPAETEVSVCEGELVWLRCAARGAPPPRVRWLRARRPVAARRERVDADGLRFVANVTDFAEYTCVASNQYGNASINYMVYVWVPPHIDPPLEELKEVEIGSDLHIECDAVGFPLPVVVWEFQEEILTDNTTNLSFDESGNLYLKNVSSNHEGLYVCVVENLAGIAKKNYFIRVNEKPKILVDNYTGPYVATDLDIVLTIACRAAGKPRPYVAWIKDGYYLDKDSRYDIDVDGTLTIKSPTIDLSGMYTCVAINSAGNDTKDVRVEIYSLPTVMQEESAVSTVTALEGSAVELHCPVTHGHTVKWYKDAALVSVGSLRLANVSRAHAALYACVSRNAVGAALARVRLRVAWPPAAPPAPPPARALRGADQYFHCPTDAEPQAQIKWLFNSKPIFGEDKDVLKVLNVQPRHSGEYECVARNEHGTVHRRFSFEVLTRPFISEFDLLEVQLKAGVNATLECIAKGSPMPKISWTFNNTNWIIENTTLISSNVSQLNEGLFRCDASNEAGVAHLVYRVVVILDATVESVVLYMNGEGTRVDEIVEISAETKVRIACKAAGNPSPIVQWIRHGNTISQNSEGIDYADLEMQRVSTSDNGEYSCIASNEGGIQEKKIKVVVLEPPRIFQSLYQNANHSKNVIDLEVILGQAFYMHCHPYGNPLPEIYWFKDDLPLRFYDDTMVSSDFGEIVFTKRAEQVQTGNYTCVARNKVGEASVVYLVDILVPPPIPKDNIIQASVFINETLNLTCPAEGRPTPYVMWVKHPYIEITESPRVRLLDDNYTLIVTETEVSDSGKYSCIITNKVGTTELIYDVVILKPPTIIGNEGNDTAEDHVVDLMKSIVLKCEVDGNPLPNITWYKDVQRLSEGQASVQRARSSSLLALWAAHARDGGAYVCVADSGAGVAHRRHYLRVRVPGKWSSWSQWSYCNVTCGLGYQNRARRCQYIDDENNVIDKISQPDKIILDESACKGLAYDRRKCHMPSCEEEETSARWSNWSKWGSCSASCGVGTQTRTRRCRSKVPCIGDNIQIRKCPGLPNCRVNREKVTDFHNSGQNAEEINQDYMPEATFEMDPDPIEPEEYDDFYTPHGKPIQRSYYDVNVTENLDQSEQGSCGPGYMYAPESKTCNDIDECLFNTNQCHLTQVCTNLPGGYRCSCSPGYYSLGAGKRCLDINECAQNTHTCEYACVNAAGGYVCACPAHLRLHRDRHRCVPPSSFRKRFYEDENAEGYLSASIEKPARQTRRYK